MLLCWDCFPLLITVSYLLCFKVNDSYPALMVPKLLFGASDAADYWSNADSLYKCSNFHTYEVTMLFSIRILGYCGEVYGFGDIVVMFT